MIHPKKHHFAPVFYLKGWCNTDAKVAEYHRPYREVVSRLVYPEATGFKPFLYTMEGAPEDHKQAIERDYMASIVDNNAATALRSLITRDPSAIDDEKVRNDWTRFMIASLYRRPQAVTDVVESFKNDLKGNLSDDAQAIEAYESVRKADDPPTLYEWMDKNHKYAAADKAKQVIVASIETPEVGQIIINMEWSVLDLSRSAHDLLTSDAPHLRIFGLKDKRCLIAFPLTPDLLFVATHDRKAERFLLTKGESGVAKWANDNAVRAADRYVYGRTESHLRFVENRLRKPPTSA